VEVGVPAHGSSPAAIRTVVLAAGWRTTSLAPGPLPPRQQAQVWSGGRALRWHALVIATDSISGGFWKSVGLGMGITVAAVVVICRGDSSCQLGD